ncbi:MAG: polyphosphate kinase 2 family protein [Candidatus Eremiobacteraeota bacterium]|nr:polyphosphate kinase 2 family protein [Candidatus Eremiobacteraeota bacterium]
MDYNRLRATPGRSVALEAYDPADTCGYQSKKDAVEKLQTDIALLEDLQDVLSAQGRNAVLIIFQGMDTSGKDGAVKHVMSGVNPVAVNVYPFRAPSEEERRHDFLWRCSRVLPERGRISIFNRSYYEDVIVTRVHPALLSLPQTDPPAEFWKARYRAINAFEQHLTDEGTLVLKFFLHLSKKEQTKRLSARIGDAGKQWKVSVSDLKERTFWDDYMRAYEKALHETSTEAAPWYVIPADHKYVARVNIAGIIVERLRALGMSYPTLTPEVARAVKEAGAAALAE